jgi:hypothetical protein
MSPVPAFNLDALGAWPTSRLKAAKNILSRNRSRFAVVYQTPHLSEVDVFQKFTVLRFDYAGLS